MKTAAFLVSVLADHFKSDAEDAARIEKRWRAEYEEFEASLPDPTERTVEQWERLVYLTGELYFALAARSNKGAAFRHVEKLAAALEEVESR